MDDNDNQVDLRAIAVVLDHNVWLKRLRGLSEWGNRSSPMTYIDHRTSDSLINWVKDDDIFN